MTTKGRALRRHDAFLTDLIGDGLRPLHELPDLIGLNAAETGEPLVVELPPNLPPAHQRLLATLGVLVRLTPDASPLPANCQRSAGNRPARPVARPAPETVEAAVRTALDGAPDDRLTDRARAWLD